MLPSTGLQTCRRRGLWSRIFFYGLIITVLTAVMTRIAMGMIVAHVLSGHDDLLCFMCAASHGGKVNSAFETRAGEEGWMISMSDPLTLP